MCVYLSVCRMQDRRKMVCLGDKSPLYTAGILLCLVCILRSLSLSLSVSLSLSLSLSLSFSRCLCGDVDGKTASVIVSTQIWLCSELLVVANGRRLIYSPTNAMVTTAITAIRYSIRFSFDFESVVVRRPLDAYRRSLTSQ